MSVARIYHPSATEPPDGSYASATLARLGIRAADPAKLAERIRRGLSPQVLDKLAAELEIPLRRLLQLLSLSPATMARRKLNKKPLTPQESDRVYRIASVLATTVRLFEGDAAAARDWLKHPVRGLDGRIPLEQLDTEPGTEAVLDLIGRLEHGVIG